MARAIDSERAYQFLTEQLVKETGTFSKGVNKGLNIARSAMRSPDAIPTLPPPNEWVKRMLELDELYTKLQVVTGFTAERLLAMFADGYTLGKPDYAKSFEDMASLAETTPPNEALTIEELREMDEPVWVACKPIEGGDGYWCLCQHGHIITPAGSIYDVKEIPHWVFYRRPPEGEEET